MEKATDMEMEREGEEEEEEEEETESVSDVLRDRFRLSTISIAEAEAKRNGMEISEPIVACISDLAFKYAEQLAKDLELFAQHASRKIVKMEDVILSGEFSKSHIIVGSTRCERADACISCVMRTLRNEHLATSLRSLCDDLKAKEPQSERKRKKTPRKENKATTSVVHIPDN